MFADAGPTGAGLAIVAVIFLVFIAVALGVIVVIIRFFLRRRRPQGPPPVPPESTEEQPFHDERG